MEASIKDRLDNYRQVLERNPTDHDAVLNTGRLLRDLGQKNLANDLLSIYLKTHPQDAEIQALAAELSGWKPVPRAPANFEEISGHMDTVYGWILKEQEKFLFDKVRSLPDGAAIVEMGCCKGKSTAAMAFACIGTRKRIYSIDSFSGNEGQMGKIEDLQPAWTANLTRFGLEPYATPLRGYTSDVVPDRSRYPAPDFVFIDASHEFTDVLEDFKTVYPYVKDGGWISFHDVELGWPGPWRVWRDYAMDILSDHEYSATLACGRKVAGRPFKRKVPTADGFPFARVLADEYAAKLGASNPLVRAMRTSLEGKWKTREDRDAVLEAEKRIAEAPEQDFHAVLKDQYVATDGRIDGHVRLWYGLSLLGQSRFEDAAEQFAAVPKVSSPLSEERTLSYEDYIRRHGPRFTPKETGVDASAGWPFRPDIRATDTVLAIGGDGSLLSIVDCARKTAVEEDRALRKHSITAFGVDSLEDWDDLPDGCADVVISDEGFARFASPLAAIRGAYAKLRSGGKAVITVGRDERTGQGGSRGKPALYSWTAETLGNLFKEAGFRVVSSGPLEPGSARLKLVAEKA